VRLIYVNYLSDHFQITLSSAAPSFLKCPVCNHGNLAANSFQVFLQFIGVVVIVSTVNPYLLIPSLVLGVIFHFIRRFYLKTARSVKRLEGIARSPVFSHLSTSLYGLTTIRAFQVEKQFARQFDAHQDLHSAAWFIFLASARWLGIFVDWCSVLYIATVTFSFLAFRQGN
jgi:ATP-binding cassette subfamily C (CFTR/MRP) protein 4